jgi:iron(III) transport system substrate-binding protein
MMFRNTLRRGDLHPARPGTRHSLTQAADAVSLTLYNGQHKEVGDAIAKAFEAKTGIHVNVRKGSSNQLASQVIEEGDRSPPT